MALSQMMRHYLEMKEKYKDCILFYRLGDFYEMFFEDAKKVSSLLDLTLTGKDCGLDERAPMCGIPYHAADGYIAKLVSMGERVAICEQLSDPKEAGRGLVDRDVVRVVSAGTLIDDSMLDATRNNYIACVFKAEDAVAVAWADITTGEFSAAEFSGETAMDDAVAQLVRLAPAEIICNEEMLLSSKELKEIRHNQLPPFSCYVPWAFNVRHAEKNLLEQFGTRSLAAYGIAGRENCISAAGALIEYLRETQKRALTNINSIKVVNRDRFMVLDGIAVRNLELVRSNAEGKKYGSLLWLLDKTRTGMGARLMNRMILSPLRDLSAIEYRQEGVAELFDASVVRMGLADTLKEVKDVERLSGKISNGNFTPRDCVALAASLNALPSVRFQLSGFTSGILSDIADGLPDMKELADTLSSAIADEPPALMKDGGYIREGYSRELDELREIGKNGKALILDVEVRERERTGIKNLKVGYNRVFGYYIEISNSFKDKVPADYIRKQTLTTGERFITEELKNLEEKILTSSERALKLESELYAGLLDELSRSIGTLQKISGALALLDCLISFATVAKERKYCRPKMTEGGRLSISEGRHPVVEAISRERFVPNDTLLDNGENRSAVITGPNMAGKSTYMRQVALIVLMAHIGSFVPAKAAEIPLTDRIFTRVGASDNLIFDQSTFMVEMTEVASILLHATEDSLLILDEVGRGTSTYDGLSIAWAVIEFLTEKIRAKTLFATHYHELTELENKIEGVKNYKVTVRELNGAIVFLRKIARGGANRSFGIEVASLAGVPKEVTQRAKGILRTLEKNDIAKKGMSVKDAGEETEEQKRPLSEAEKILLETDVNTLSPMQALLLLGDLKEKVQSENPEN
ncbi:MAG TPA: DNA mismatch repair protein MutS [Candidatus Scatosoma pullicola]|nr:DNA mismatch repair protein MutS [Candidatus Scatosoma pullicola]